MIQYKRKEVFQSKQQIINNKTKVQYDITNCIYFDIIYTEIKDREENTKQFKILEEKGKLIILVAR